MELALYLAEKATEIRRLAAIAGNATFAADLLGIAESLSLNAAESLSAHILDADERSKMVVVAHRYFMGLSLHQVPRPKTDTYAAASPGRR